MESEFRRETPLLRSQFKRRELTELFILVVRFPFMRRSFIESGLEWELFNQMRKPTPPQANPDFTGITSIVQMTNISDFQGYRITTTMGFELTQLDFKFEPAETRSRGFITIYAGLGL